MDSCLSTCKASTCDLCSDTIWTTLYPLLLSLVKRWTYNTRVFRGQENDVAWDVVQVAIRKTFEYALKARREGIPIVSLKRLSITIAKNYYRDLLRRDSRLVRFTSDEDTDDEQSLLDNLVDLSETAFDKVYEEWLFARLAKEIACLPGKTRIALLTDLANRMSFLGEPTPLQRAFLDVGIFLQEYQRPLPEDPAARSRHAALLGIAYKRLRKLVHGNVLYNPAA